MIVTILNQLNKTGDLKRLVACGFVSTTVPQHLEIYLDFDRRQRTTKNSKTKNISLTAENFSLSERTIYNIIDKFEHD